MFRIYVVKSLFLTQTFKGHFDTNRCKSVVYIHGTSREVSRGATQQVVEECEVARK